MPRLDPLHQVACCQSLPAQPVACCHVWWDLLETMTIQKDAQNFPIFQLLPLFAPLANPSFLDMFRLSWPWAFVLTLLTNKVSPNLNMSIYFPFILPTLCNHVDVTLAYDDDRQIRAHKTAIPLAQNGVSCQ